jgi:hypothetical protein
MLTSKENPMRIPVLITAALLTAASFAAEAQSMKPGLWEIHNKSDNPQMAGGMAEMQKQLAQMPPEQRKQMEAMMAQRGVKMAAGSDGAMVVQVCMTKEMAERNDVPMQDGCRMTKQERSGNTMKMAFACTNPPSSGEGQVTFNGPEAYASRMTVRSVEQGRTEAITMESSGKWLKADCGSVKPVATKK